MESEKKWWRSKTLWFNAAIAAATTAEASLGILRPIMGGTEFAVIAFILAIGNTILRIITTQGLTK